jgi:hypothetical protein
VDEAVEHILGQLVAQHLLDPAVAAMKSRPRVATRTKEVAPPRASSKPGGKKAAAKPAPAPAKGAKKTAPKQRAAARTARAASRSAPGSKRR